VGRALRPRSAAGAKRRRRDVQLPAKYSHEYPVSQGHQYRIRSVPLAVWTRAMRRAHGEQRSIRVVLIRALELYADGRLDL
jgi:hypothetical protein